jgi:hypothetical protein
MKKALIVGTPTANSSYESGATLRLDTISAILEFCGYEVTKSSTKFSNSYLNVKWDLLVCVSFATLRKIFRTSIRYRDFWFDPCDSWHLVRRSQFKEGNIKSLIAYPLDIFSIKRMTQPDLVTFINQRDAKWETKYLESRNLKPLILPNQITKYVLNESTERRLIFLGDGGYSPNRVAVKQIVKILRTYNIEMNLKVIGRNYTDHKNDRVEYLGYVPNPHLFHKGDIMIAPMTSGGGVKMKVVNALTAGISVVTNPEGASGLRDLPNLHVYNSPQDIADCVKKLLTIEPIKNVPTQNPYLDDDYLEVVNWLKHRH